MAFQVTISEDRDIVILELAGRIDSFAIDDLNGGFDKAMKSGKRNVLLVMRDLEYINSRGIGTLISFFKWVKKVGGMVKIAEVPLNIMQVLNLLGLDGLTLIYDSSSDAVASFRRQQARDERAEGEEEIVPSGGQIPAERPPKAQSRAPLFLSGAALLLALVLLVLFAAMETGPSTAVDVGPVREKLALLEQRLVRLETQRQEAPRVLQKVEGLSRDLSERVASVARDLDQIREEIRSMSGKMVRAGDGGSGPERPSLRYHRVQRGESLYRIARRYGTSVAELCRLNRIQTNKVIYPGQRLVVGEDS